MKSLLILEEDEWALLYFPAFNHMKELQQVIWAPEFAYNNALADEYERLLSKIKPLLKKPDSSQQKITRWNKED